MIQDDRFFLPFKPCLEVTAASTKKLSSMNTIRYVDPGWNVNLPPQLLIGDTVFQARINCYLNTYYSFKFKFIVNACNLMIFCFWNGINTLLSKTKPSFNNYCKIHSWPLIQNRVMQVTYYSFYRRKRL